MPQYRYAGARSLILLHEIHIKSFLTIWKKAKEANIKLPATSDPHYESMLTLLQHVLRSARGYMIWMCEKLELENPQIDEVPPVTQIEEKASDFANHLLQRWALPLIDVEEERFNQVFKSNWGVDHCIESMLEHAAMHPIRHEFQLQRLIEKQK